MVRNKLLLKIIGIRPKTIIHIGAGNGEDREEYFGVGAQKLIWVEASVKKYLDILKRYPNDTVLNFYVTNDFDKSTDLNSSKFFSHEKPTQIVKLEDAPKKSLDQIFSNFSFDLPLQLVIDTDGAEIDILSGAENLLKKVSYLVIEQHFNWDEGNWHEEISSLCLKNHFQRTLSRLNHTNDYEDVLWTRFHKRKIVLIRITDFVFFGLKQLKHFANNNHFSTTYFNCNKCEKFSKLKY